MPARSGGYSSEEAGMILTILYELIVVLFVGLSVWNLLTHKDVFKQIAMALVIIPFVLRMLFIR